MTVCPGKKGPSLYGFTWERSTKHDVRQIMAWGAASVLTLMEDDELAALGVDHLQACVKSMGMQWHFAPIRDLSAPGKEFEQAWTATGTTIRRQLAEGKKILVHCRGGLGRTGMIVARILMDFGLSTQEAITRVRQIRPGAIQTREQEEHLEEYVPDGRRQLNHFQGCLVGGAVGDALGAAVEFDSSMAIFEAYGDQGISSFGNAYGRRGAITDDTQMTLFTAEGLLRAECRSVKKGIDPIFTQITHKSYLRWLKTQDPQSPVTVSSKGWLLGVDALHQRRAPGNTCLSALESGRYGTPEHTINASKGCGGVMRVAPVGLFMQSEIVNFPVEDRHDWAFEIGCDLAAITHGHPTGYLSAGAFACIISALLAGQDLPAAIRAASDRLAPIEEAQECRALLQKAVALAGDFSCSPGAKTINDHLGEGWVGEEALAIAVYAVLIHPEDFDAAIRLAVNHDGDSDSTGSMAGNLSGALLGIDAISDVWLNQLELNEVIRQVATDLFIGFSHDEYWWDRYPGY